MISHKGWKMNEMGVGGVNGVGRLRVRKANEGLYYEHHTITLRTRALAEAHAVCIMGYIMRSQSALQ